MSRLFDEKIKREDEAAASQIGEERMKSPKNAFWHKGNIVINHGGHWIARDESGRWMPGHYATDREAIEAIEAKKKR